MVLLYILKRIAFGIPTLLVVAIVVFALIRLVPGDPAQIMLRDINDPALLAAERARMGLDQPIPFQFLTWGKGVLTGDLGRSIINDAEVLPLILERFQVTAVIVVLAVSIAGVLAVALGTIAAWRQNSKLDLAIVGLATVLLSIPSFWLGLLLLLLFGLKLGWVPVIGYVPFAENPLQSLAFAVLPVMTLAFVETGLLTRMARAATIDVLRLDYIAHARSKGLSEGQVLRRHVLKNAFAPTLTLIGVVLGNLLGGIAVIETVFTLPGLGRLLVDGIMSRDYPVIQGVMLFIAAIYVFVNLIVDLLYPIFDPRVTAE